VANAGLATATGAAQQPSAAGAEVSPALELSGFGTFTGVTSGAVINSVTVAVTEHQSSALMAACTFELWDYSGAGAQIGTTQTGTASTGAGNVSSAAFTGVTYSQLATLRVRVYGHAGTAGSGAVESADAVSLTVSYTLVPGTSAPAGLATATGTAQQPSAGTGGSVLDEGSGGVLDEGGAAVQDEGSAGATTANAGLATASGTAQPAAFRYAPAGLATGTGAAQAPAGGTTANAGLATGTGAAQQPAGHNAGLATGTGAAQQPAVTVSGSTTASAGLAAGTGTAPQASVSASGTSPYSADTAQAAESAFYNHAGADAGTAAEGARLAVRSTDSAFGRDAPLSAWPSARDAATAADKAASAWPAGADTGHAAEAVKPFPASSADTGHAAEAVHAVGVWTYVPASVHLLAPAPHRHDPVRAGRLDEAVRRLAERGNWASLTRLVRSTDRAASAESATAGEGRLLPLPWQAGTWCV